VIASALTPARALSLRSLALACVRSALEDACVPALPDLALAAGVAVFEEPLVEPEEALGLVVDPFARADVSPEAEPLRFELVFIEELELPGVPFEALGDGVVVPCDELARSLLPGLEAPLDCAKVAPLKASAENRTPAEMRCLPFGFMNFSFVAPGTSPGPEPSRAQWPYPLQRLPAGKRYPIAERIAAEPGGSAFPPRSIARNYRVELTMNCDEE